MDKKPKKVIVRRVKPQKTGPKKMLAFLGVLVSSFFLLNLTMGVIEIPDNLPFIGNMDEVFFSGILFACLRYLGLDLIPFRKNT